MISAGRKNLWLVLSAVKTHYERTMVMDKYGSKLFTLIVPSHFCLGYLDFELIFFLMHILQIFFEQVIFTLPNWSYMRICT